MLAKKIIVKFKSFNKIKQKIKLMEIKLSLRKKYKSNKIFFKKKLLN